MTRPQRISAPELGRLTSGQHHDPHSVLGAHLDGETVTVRALRPWAIQVTALVDGQRFALEHQHEGVWAAGLDRSAVPDYQLEVTGPDGTTTVVDDPYRYLPTVRELDLHLIGEGRHEKLWEVLGAHVRRYATPSGATPSGSVTGTSFAVWAPNARGVRVVGDFNHWDGRAYPMRSLGSGGVWELFVPDVGDGTRYKYEILGPDGTWRQKADPLAAAAEVPPATASVVYSSSYRWGDADWLTRRERAAPHREPMSVYEVHLGSWRQGRDYRELAEELTSYVSEVGFTHVELLPVAEHPFGGSWGYQVTSYFAPTARFGTPDDFRYLVDRLHQAEIGVLVDWVPAHFPRDDWALARFDGAPLYEHADPRRGEQPDWGTLIFDFGRHEVRNFLVANALYWFEEFHIDGLRVDAVASMLYLDYSREGGEWTPNQYGGRENLDAVAFLQEMNSVCYGRVPGIVTIAEESTAWPGVTRPVHLGGLGFGMKWNMGWMNDSLSYLQHDPVHRQYHHHTMTFSLVYAHAENYVLPLSHDEVVHGKQALLTKMPGDRWQQLATLRAYLAFMWAHPGKQLLFMGGELAQESEWSHERELEWRLLELPDHAGVQRLVRDLNFVYRDTAALWALDSDPAGFCWIDANDAAGNTFSFARFAADNTLIACVANFSAAPRLDYRLGLPRVGDWEHVINTDVDAYGGSGVSNPAWLRATDQSWGDHPASVTLNVPPLGTVWLRHTAAAPG